MKKPPDTLALLYGGRPILLHEATPLREAIGPLLARAETADFAVARLRLGAVDLRAHELGGLTRCRVLVEHVDAITSGEPLGAARQDVRARLELLLAFLESGRVEVRVAAGRCWAPDFSVLHNLRGRAGETTPGMTALGAHFFSKPYPVSGPALTQFSTETGTVAVADRAFADLWACGYDVAFVIADRLRRLLASPQAGATGAGGPVEFPGPARAASPPVVRESAHCPSLVQSPPGEVRPQSPAAVARLALTLRFDRGGAAASGSPQVFELAEFQTEAVERAQAALARHGGVLLADGVGLGKTFLGLALAEVELARGGSVAVVTPAALRKEWLRSLHRLAREYRTALRIARMHCAESPGARLIWMSHSRLSRDGASFPEAPSLVVVDEAHAFRNPRTRRYRALAGLCRGARVVLLSATPVNNTLWDLYFQLRLFAADGAFRTVGVPALGEAFRAAADGRSISAVLPVLREVVIRRTRPFLRDHYGAVSLPGAAVPLRFPSRAAPQPVSYELGAAFPGGLPAIARILADLTFAPYRVRAYARGQAPEESAPELLRFSLLKRLESSRSAFQESIASLVQLYEAFVSALAEGRLLRPRERSLVESDQLLLAALALDPLPDGLDRARLAADAARDLDALRRLVAKPDGVPDGKLGRLESLVKSLNEKVVVFTEFRATAKQIATALQHHRVGLVHGGGAWLGGAPIARRELIARFAPRANGATPPGPAERVDVLIATDVLAEGLNLQDARCVVSYDLPWNPVRLMQRIGRVDRLGSPHEEVLPFHFVPERGLEELLGLLRRIRRKLAVIRGAVPGDASVLDARSDDAAMVRVLAGDAAALERLERSEAAPFEAADRLRRLAAVAGGPLQPPGDPLAATLSLRGIAVERILLCYESTSAVWLVWNAGDGMARDDDLAASEIVAGALDCERILPLDPPTLARADAAGRRALALRALPPVTTPRGVAARASARLLRAMSASRHSPDPDVCARADRLLERLDHGLDAGGELAVREALAHAREEPLRFVDRLEGALEPQAPHRRGHPEGPNGCVPPGEGDPWGVHWRLRAAIHVRPAEAGNPSC